VQLFEFKDLLLSFLRWGIGLAIGTTLGVILALIAQIKPISNRLINVIIDFLRAIPIIGLIPLIQINFGVNEFGKIGLISWAVSFPVWISINAALKKRYLDLELIFKGINLSKRDYLVHYVLTRAREGLVTGVELSIGVAWLSVVAAEWIGTYTVGFWSGGLGYKLLLGYELNNWLMLHLNLLVFGLLGFSSSIIWRILFPRKNIIK